MIVKMILLRQRALLLLLMILYYVYMFCRIHNIPSVPVVDLFQKIRQQVKCYLMTASSMEPSEIQEVLLFITY